jgi:hypothetical protein
MQEQILARVLESPSLAYVMLDESCADLTAILIPVGERVKLKTCNEKILDAQDASRYF